MPIIETDTWARKGKRSRWGWLPGLFTAGGLLAGAALWKRRLRSTDPNPGQPTSSLPHKTEQLMDDLDSIIQPLQASAPIMRLGKVPTFEEKTDQQILGSLEKARREVVEAWGKMTGATIVREDDDWG